MQENKKKSGRRCTIGEFAPLVGVSVRTLQRWDAEGRLVAGRLPSGRRYYTAEHYIRCGGSREGFDAAIARLDGGADG